MRPRVFRRPVLTIFAPCCFALALSFPFISSTYAQNSAGPQPVPRPAPVPAPADKPYPGTISLSVDLTNVNDRILTVHETIPVKSAGQITLLYPQWLPGTHSPSNSIANMAGLIVTANGKRLSWLRDRVDMWAFHIDVPAGATALDLTFQYLPPINPEPKMPTRMLLLPRFLAYLHP